MTQSQEGPSRLVLGATSVGDETLIELAYEEEAQKYWTDLSAGFLMHPECNIADQPELASQLEPIMADRDAGALRSLLNEGRFALQLRSLNQSGAPPLLGGDLVVFLERLLMPAADLHAYSQELSVRVVIPHDVAPSELATHDGALGSSPRSTIPSDAEMERFSILSGHLEEFEWELQNRPDGDDWSSEVTVAVGALRKLLDRAFKPTPPARKLTAKQLVAAVEAAFETTDLGPSRTQRLTYVYAAMVQELAGFYTRPPRDPEKHDVDQARFERIDKALRRERSRDDAVDGTP